MPRNLIEASPANPYVIGLLAAYGDIKIKARKRWEIKEAAKAELREYVSKFGFRHNETWYFIIKDDMDKNLRTYLETMAVIRKIGPKSYLRQRGIKIPDDFVRRGQMIFYAVDIKELKNRDIHLQISRTYSRSSKLQRG